MCTSEIQYNIKNVFIWKRYRTNYLTLCTANQENHKEEIAYEKWFLKTGLLNGIKCSIKIKGSAHCSKTYWYNT